MSPEDLKALARRLAQEVLTQGDLAVAAEIFAPGCLHHAPQPMPPGAEGIKPWVTALRRAFPDLHAIVDDEIAEGDTVVQRLTLGGTQDGAFCGIPASRRRVTWRLVEVLRAGPDGTFTEHWSIWDRLGLLCQIDAVPDPAEGRRR